MSAQPSHPIAAASSSSTRAPRRLAVKSRLLAAGLALLTAASAQAGLTKEQREKILEDNGFKRTDLVPAVRQDRRELLTKETGNPPSQTDLDTATDAATTKKLTTADAALDNAGKSLESLITGLGVGAGVAMLQTNGARPVDTASVDSGNVVRIATKSKMRIGPILETHWLFSELPFQTPADPKKAGPNQETAASTTAQLRHSADYDEATGQLKQGATAPQAYRWHRTWGPMATIELGDNTIRSAGLGLMLAFQHYSIDGNGAVTPHGMAFNVGLIGFAESNVKRVVGPYTDGQTVAAGTTLRVQEEGRYGWGVVFSARF